MSERRLITACCALAVVAIACGCGRRVREPQARLSPGWGKVGTVLEPGCAHCTIACDEANDRYVMAYIEEATKLIKWAAATADAPHEWQPIAATTPQPGKGWYSLGGRGVELVHSGGKWFLYFDDLRSGTIGLAQGVSLDALETLAQPVLKGTRSPFSQEQYVRHPAVVPPEQSHDGLWHMIYDGRRGSTGGAFGDLRHATSRDGIVWEKDAANNPVMRPSRAGDFEADDVGSPSILRVGDTYWLAYHGYNKRFGDTVPHFPHWIGVARSVDLIQWERQAENPVLPLGKPGEFDSLASFGPAWHPHHDETLYLYFTGLTDGDRRRIGYASFALDGRPRADGKE
jgi:hypothetical protein